MPLFSGCLENQIAWSSGQRGLDTNLFSTHQQPISQISFGVLYHLTSTSISTTGSGSVLYIPIVIVEYQSLLHHGKIRFPSPLFAPRPNFILDPSSKTEKSDIFLIFSTRKGQVQTPNQRKGNERYAKFEAAKRGKPESVIKAKKKDFKSPVSTVWIGSSDHLL